MRLSRDELAREYDDNWPKGSLQEFIWERCEMDNTRVREIMLRVERLLLEARRDELEKFYCSDDCWETRIDRIKELNEELSRLGDSR